MHRAATTLHDQDVSLAFGTVTGRLDGLLLVRLGTRVIPADRATGCLVAPQEGDRVLLAGNDSGEAFILSVLTRASDEPALVGIDTGFSLAAPGGTVGIAADTVRLTATTGIELVAPDVGLTAREATIRAWHLRLTGECLSQAFASVKTMAGAVERTVGRLVERLRRVYRRVEEVEDTRLGRLRLRVDDSLRINAEQVAVAAEADLRLDGKKILIG
jgi:hypothetical protein